MPTRIVFTDSEYSTHGASTRADRDILTSTWNLLSDYWLLVKGRESVDTAWKAGQRMVDGLYTQAQAMDGAWAMEKYPLALRTAGITPIQFLFGTEDYFTNCDGGSTRSEFLDEIPEGAVLCLPNGAEPTDEYILPAWMRFPASFSDFVKNPTLTLVPDDDFEIDTSVLDNKTGVVTFLSDYKDIMWCSFSLIKSISKVIVPFGDMVGYTCRQEGRFETSVFYDVRALQYAAQNAPTQDTIELGISVFNLWPYTPFKSQVTAITGSTSITLRNVDDIYETVTLTNPSTLPFQQRTDAGWVDLAVMDVIEPYRAITASCMAETWISNQELLEEYGYSEISGRQALLLLFDADLPLTGVSAGWLPDSTISATPVIPSLSGYSIDQDRTLAFINRIKNSGMSARFIVFLDVDLSIVSISTTYRMMGYAAVCSIFSSYRAVMIPDPLLISSYGGWISIPVLSVDTTYRTLADPIGADAETTYGKLPAVPAGSLGATTY